MIDFTRFVERYEQFNASLFPSDNITESRINDLYIRVCGPEADLDEVLM